MTHSESIPSIILCNNKILSDILLWANAISDLSLMVFDQKDGCVGWDTYLETPLPADPTAKYPYGWRSCYSNHPKRIVIMSGMFSGRPLGWAPSDLLSCISIQTGCRGPICLRRGECVGTDHCVTVSLPETISTATDISGCCVFFPTLNHSRHALSVCDAKTKHAF